MYVCNSGTHLSFISISLSVDRTSIHLSKHSILYCDGARLRLTITDVSRDNIRNESVISLISGRASSILFYEPSAGDMAVHPPKFAVNSSSLNLPGSICVLSLYEYFDGRTRC